MLHYFPVNPQNKRPLVKNWGIYNGRAEGTYGIALSERYLIVDVDPRNGGLESEETMLMLGLLPETKMVTTASGGRHYYYHKPPEVKTRKKVELYEGIDFLSKGAYVIGEGSKIKGVEYVSNDVEIAFISLDLLDEIKYQNEEIIIEPRTSTHIEPQELKLLLNHLPNSYANNYEQWLKVGMCIHHTTQGSQEGLDIWDEWSRSSQKYKIGQCSAKWNSFKHGKQSEVTLGTLITYAIQHGYTPTVSKGDNLGTLNRPETKDPFDTLTELQDWVYVVNVRQFYNIVDRRTFDTETMRLYYRRVIPKGDTISIILQSNFITIVDGFVYVPNGTEFIKEGTMTFVNTWRGVNIKPRVGDASIFEDHLKWMLGSDWEILRNWMAWFIQYPAKRLTWAMLVTSPSQGVGKSYAAETLTKLLGKENVSKPSNESIHERYTGWMVNKQLVIVSEIMSAGRRDLMNKLKELITDEIVPVREMYIPEYWTKATFALYFTSNYDSPIVLEANDRRFCVLKSFMKPQPESYYQKLWDWTDDNLDVIKHYLMSVDLKDFSQHRPPKTFAKDMLIQDTNFNGHDDTIDQWVKNNNRTLFTLIEVTEAVQPDLDEYEYLDSRKIANLLRRNYQFLRRIRIDGSIQKIYAINDKVNDYKNYTNQELAALWNKERKNNV